MVRLNRAVAVARAYWARGRAGTGGWTTSEPALARYHLRHAVRGDLRTPARRGADAAAAFEEAARLTHNAGERAVMLRRAAEALGG